MDITDPQSQSVYDSAQIIHVDNTEMPVDANARVNQQQILPVSVKARLLGNLITDVPPQENLILASTATVPNAVSVTFLFNISDPDDREIFVMPLIGFFVASGVVRSFSYNDAWPNGTFGMGNCPVSIFQDVNLLVQTDATIANNTYVRAIMRNNTGGTISVKCQGRFRIIANPGQSSGATN